MRMIREIARKYLGHSTGTIIAAMFIALWLVIALTAEVNSREINKDVFTGNRTYTSWCTRDWEWFMEDLRTKGFKSSSIGFSSTGFLSVWEDVKKNFVVTFTEKKVDGFLMCAVTSGSGYSSREVVHGKPS